MLQGPRRHYSSPAVGTFDGTIKTMSRIDAPTKRATVGWTPTGGNASLVVRATDGTGALQDAEVRPALPDGATGYHHISVRVG